MDKELTVKLVKAMQAGDQNAAGQLYEASYQDIYYFILKTVKEKELAEDLTQDTFIKIMENISQLQEPEAFVGWSRQIAYHSCTAYFRKHKELLMDENEDGGTVFDTITEENAEFIPHEALDKEDLKKTILGMIDSLPQEQRAAMVLRYYEELPVSQIAQIQGVSEGTVKSRLNYGRNAVRKSVEAYEKKNGVKLHSFAILPLPLWLFRKQKLQKGKPVTTLVVGTKGTAASGSRGAAKAASKGFFSTLGGKITAAVLAVAVVGGGIAAAIGIANNGNNDGDRKKKDREENSVQQVQEPEYAYGQNTLSDRLGDKVGQCGQVQNLVFTDQAVPEGVETVDVSLNDDGSVVMWMDGSTMYITTADGGPLYAPENGNFLFSGVIGIGESLESVAFDNFDTYYMKSTAGMFSSCRKLGSLDLSGWNMSNVEDTNRMFAECVQLKELELSGWDMSKVQNMSQMFQGCKALTDLDIGGWDTGNVTNMADMFDLCCSLTELDLSSWDVSSVTQMQGMFSNCSKMVSLNVATWDTSNVQNMEKMFLSCDALAALDVADWNTAKVEFMSLMFGYCKSLSDLDVSGWDVSNVQDMQVMFRFTAIRNLDLSGWDVGKVTNMCMMFSDCTQLTTLNVSGWDVSNVVNMDCMFYDCKQLTALDVAGWNVSKVQVFSGMFYQCASLTELAIGGWNVSAGAAIRQMLDGCSGLPAATHEIVESWYNR